MSTRSTITIYLDDLSDHVTLTDEGADAQWPTEVEVELDIKWYPAEPDVGIFSEQPEIVGTDYYLDGERFTDERKFVEALYQLVGEWCEEDQDALAELIANRIDNEELENDE